MPEDKSSNICAYPECGRPIWVNGGPRETMCLFHSEQLEKKKDDFDDEIDKYKKGIFSTLLETEIFMKG